MQALQISTVPVIFHGFRKSFELAKQLLQRGYYLSFGAPLLYDTSLQACFTQIPLNRVFLETDDSTSITIAQLYREAAAFLHTDVGYLTLQLHDNYQRLFFPR